MAKAGPEQGGYVQDRLKQGCFKTHLRAHKWYVRHANYVYEIQS